ncbi:hypothetical protein ACOMHN_005547 [Nucella lapillus]
MRPILPPHVTSRSGSEPFLLQVPEGLTSSSTFKGTRVGVILTSSFANTHQRTNAAMQVRMDSSDADTPTDAGQNGQQ